MSDYPVTRVKIFHGSLEVLKAAEEEHDQSQVQAFTAVKTTMSFRFEFANGEVICPILATLMKPKLLVNSPSPCRC